MDFVRDLNKFLILQKIFTKTSLHIAVSPWLLTLQNTKISTSTVEILWKRAVSAEFWVIRRNSAEIVEFTIFPQNFRTRKWLLFLYKSLQKEALRDVY